jgi:hypothetical protein
MSMPLKTPPTIKTTAAAVLTLLLRPQSTVLSGIQENIFDRLLPILTTQTTHPQQGRSLETIARLRSNTINIQKRAEEEFRDKIRK